MRAGRQRGIAAACIRLQAIFRRTWLHELPLIEQAMGRQALALLKQVEAAAQAEAELAEATRIAFQQHPHAAIFTSFPGWARFRRHASWPRSATILLASPTLAV